MNGALTDTENPPVRPASRLNGLSPYAPPVRSGADALLLDSNEGAPASGSVVDALRSIDAEDLRRYPSAAALETELARRWSVDPTRVVVTNGADDAIDRVCRAVLEPGRELLVHAPTFEMIERSGRLAGGTIRAVDWLDGPFPTERFVEAITPRTALVSLVSPNNPTGGVVPRDALRRIVSRAREQGALVMLDGAYAEFASEDPAAELLQEPNVVVVRTFSKAFGLAGIRLGYLVAPEGVAPWMRTVGGPYPASSVSLALAGVALERESERLAYTERVRAERASLTALLSRGGVPVLASEANFVTADFSSRPFASDALRSFGVSVRDLSGRAELAGYLRITLPGSDADWPRLQHAARSVLEPEAILFDMDGVLADVSDSYRAAIIETARSFGVDVDAEEIRLVKLEGNANNDWDVTRDLLQRRGLPCDRAEVVRRFQKVYLGAGPEDGLRQRETLIPQADMLERLSKDRPLGIVTGRPRAEAEWFLEREGLADLFTVLVCMEDAPAKPSPDPIHKAMRALGVECAWMVGDTPDDIASARAAGVMPVGVCAPGDDNSAAAAAFARSGAGVVLDQLGQLEEMV